MLGPLINGSCYTCLFSDMFPETIALTRTMIASRELCSEVFRSLSQNTLHIETPKEIVSPNPDPH